MSLFPTRFAPSAQLSGRFARYTGGSVVAFATSEAAFVVCYASGVVGTTGATLIAFVAGAVPNYVLNRRWVWKRRGAVHLWREVVLYAAVSALSLVLASAATGWATHAVVGDRATATVAAAGAYFAVYAALFVAKFVAFDKVVFTPRGNADTAVVGASSAWDPIELSAERRGDSRPM
jgi:putative flippase GtrA